MIMIKTTAVAIAKTTIITIMMIEIMIRIMMINTMIIIMIMIISTKILMDNYYIKSKGDDSN